MTSLLVTLIKNVERLITFPFFSFIILMLPSETFNMHPQQGIMALLKPNAKVVCIGFCTGYPRVKFHNPHPPHEKPAPLRWVMGFPLSWAGVFTRDWDVLAGSCTDRVAG
jgi:hypothetical protein